MANAVNFFLNRHLSKNRERQAEEQADAAVQRDVRIAKGPRDLFRRARDGGGIGNAPVRSDGLAGPDGAGFLRGVVANRKDKMHFGRAGLGEFVPALAAQSGGGQARGFELLQGVWMDASRGMAAGAEGAEIRAFPLIENGLGQDGPRGISRAQE